MIVAAIIAALAIAFSFVTWSRPSAIGLRGSSDQWQTVRGILFALWSIILPVYFLWEWHYQPRPENLPAYVYEHKVWTDVWLAGTVLLGVLFGAKKE